MGYPKNALQTVINRFNPLFRSVFPLKTIKYAAVSATHFPKPTLAILTVWAEAKRRRPNKCLLLNQTEGTFLAG